MSGSNLFKKIGVMPWLMLIAVLAFPLVLNALEALCNPATQIRNFQIKAIASGSDCQVEIEGDQVFLKIPDVMAQPNDDVCLKTANVFHAICSLDPKIVLYVSRLTPKILWNGSGSERDSGENRIENHWIPSARNPMTLEWTRQLIDYDKWER